jgi:hypothetical protein
MAQDTKQPDMLRQIFEALGNDPFVVAATDWFTQHLQPYAGIHIGCGPLGQIWRKCSLRPRV